MRRPGLILLLGSLTALSPLATDLYLPAFPEMARDLGSGPAAVQWTLTTYLVGVAAGQLVIGPLSDTMGRRRPLQAGLLAYALATLACAWSPNVLTLAGARLVQGAIAASSLVITRAVVRDLFEGAEVSRFLSRLMVITGLVPILAPFAGGQILRWTDWRGTFDVLAATGLVMLAATTFFLPETLPEHLRRRGSLTDTRATYRTLSRDRVFVGMTLTCGLAFAALLVYISQAPFVFQDQYRVSPQTFGLLFGINSLCLVGAGQVSGRMVRRVAPVRLLSIALPLMVLGGALLLGCAVVGTAHVQGVMLPMWAVLAGVGVVTPNATALALADYPHAAGTASAYLGSAQFVVGGVLAPATAAFDIAPALSMSCAIALACVGSLLTFRWARSS
jgi:DHA1 family bicyclomycin/chloramphenicol resistance-like MFS transporter